MHRKKLKIWLPFLFSIAVIIGMFLGFKMRDSLPKRSFFFLEKRKPIEEVLDLVKAKYVDKVNTSQLADTAIQAILFKLDPHSQYIPASSVSQANDDIAGNFYGIGIEFNIYDDTLNVLHVIKDGPASKAGLQVGDKLLTAGDSVLAGKKRDAASMRSILMGNRGTLLQLKVKRDNQVIPVTISRDIVPVSSVDAAYIIQPGTGFIRLNKFSQQTYREFMLALQMLKEKGMNKLILDLRGNGGGVLDESVEIADEFLSGDKLVTYTEGLHSDRKDYRCRRQGQFEEGQVVLLADEGTASASEILIGALQDWDRATVIGRQTFGKGLVQEQYMLSDGSALRLTVSRYYTPLGRSIQRSYENGFMDYYSRPFHQNPDSSAVDTSRPRKVFSTAKGKLVYGGGGITPDIRVGTDTSQLGYTIVSLFAKGLVSDFGYKYAVANKQLKNRFSNPEAFNSGFSVDQETFEFFRKLALKDSLDINNLQPNERNFLLKSLKLSLARQLFRNEGYFQVMNKEDEAVLRALKELNK